MPRRGVGTVSTGKTRVEDGEGRKLMRSVCTEDDHELTRPYKGRISDSEGIDVTEFKVGEVRL